ncbi:DNA-3-methyladenine glycosylase 2 family protein [Streptomyces sp. NPDC059786]|uniref:DNA-3-methyladenine glycosylase 2 family protein n=1 Tax=Streptomyces sp. NPDC059786 TaxID=3346946 RepID=UPI00364B81B7
MPDFETYYRAMASRDPRFDGSFYVAVTTTGVYCRPVCGSRTPKPQNVRFFRVAAAAEAAGFRACRRCRPEVHPSSPEWNVRGDLVGRALRLIARGAVDEVGVSGVARQLAVSERHLHRQLVAEVGAGPLSLALNRRNQMARLLLEAGELPLPDVAFAAGYSSLRQFNEGIRAAFGCPPRELRRAGRTRGTRQDDRTTPVMTGDVSQPGARPEPQPRSEPLVLRLRYRPPLAADTLLSWFRDMALPGVQDVEDRRVYRTLRLPRGQGRAELDLRDLPPVPLTGPGAKHQQVTVRLWLSDLRDVTAAVRRCRDLLDLDCDPAAVAGTLSPDARLGPLVRATPGLRVPGCADGFELAVRLLARQYLTRDQARRLCSWLVTRYGDPLTVPDGAPALLFPAPAALADADLTGALVAASIRTPEDTYADHLTSGPAAIRASAFAACGAIHALANAVAGERLSLERDTDRETATAVLLRLPGVESWTVQRIARHVLGDPDAFDAGEPGIRPGTSRPSRAPTSPSGLPLPADGLNRSARRWRPWRSYAAMYLACEGGSRGAHAPG